MYLPTSIRSLLSGESGSRTWDESSFNTVMTVVISWLAFWNSPAARSFSNIESGPLTIPMRIELTEPSSGLKLFTYKTTEWASVAWKNSSRWCGETKLNKKALPPKVFHLNAVAHWGFIYADLEGRTTLYRKNTVTLEITMFDFDWFDSGTFYGFNHFKFYFLHGPTSWQWL